MRKYIFPVFAFLIMASAAWGIGMSNGTSSLFNTLACEDVVANRCITEEEWTTTAINTSATTTACNNPGKAGYIHILATGSTWTLTVYDNTAGSGTVIIPTFTITAVDRIKIDRPTSLGMTLVTSGATPGVLLVGCR